LKIDKQFQPANHSFRLFKSVFYTQYLRFWEQWLTEMLLCQPWESIEIDGLFYGHH